MKMTCQFVISAVLGRYCFQPTSMAALSSSRVHLLFLYNQKDKTQGEWLPKEDS